MGTLGRVLLINAVSCFAFGFILFFKPYTMSFFVSSSESYFRLMQAIGLLLMIHSAHLTTAAFRKHSSVEVYYFALLDYVWAVLTLGMVGFEFIITSTHGITLTVLIATYCTIIGTVQFLAARHFKKTTNSQEV